MYFTAYQWLFALFSFLMIILFGLRNFGTDYGYYISVFRSLEPVYWEQIPAMMRYFGAFNPQLPFFLINSFFAILFLISIKRQAFPIVYCFIFISTLSPHLLGAFREGFGHALVLGFTIIGLPKLYFIAFFAHIKFFIVFFTSYLFARIFNFLFQIQRAIKTLVLFSVVIKILILINYNFNFLTISKNIQITGLLYFDGLERRELLDWFILSLWRFIRLCFFAYLLSRFFLADDRIKDKSICISLSPLAAPFWFFLVFVSDLLFDLWSPFSMGISGRGVGSLAICEILFFASLKKPLSDAVRPLCFFVLFGLSSMYAVKLIHTINYQLQITEEYKNGDPIEELF